MSEHWQVVVGSQNPVKIAAAKAAIERAWPERQVQVQGVAALSGVADQPMSEAETLQGAHNRVHYCQQHQPADFYVAFEGGVEQFSYGVATFAYVVVAAGVQGAARVGRTANLPLPAAFYRELQAGAELGDVLDRHFGTTNIKQAGGAIGLLTDNLEDRGSTYRQALTLALAPLLHPTWFSKE